MNAAKTYLIDRKVHHIYSVCYTSSSCIISCTRSGHRDFRGWFAVLLKTIKTKYLRCMRPTRLFCEGYRLAQR
ncbi:hypothetical protein IF2G_02155 [Cordyceps javanica]|nr:hypothetical protein IF2G_02155 [Cordyceps javanica]